MKTSDTLSILQVITQRRFSGAERICLSLCEELQRRGHRVRLLCKAGGQMAEEARKLAIEVKTPGISGKLNLLAPGRIIQAAREIKADVIHTHLSTASLMGSIAGRLSGIPALAHVHALNSWRCFQFSNLVATCSAGVANHIIEQGAPAERVRVVLNGIDLRRFEHVPQKQECRRMLNIPPGAPVVACIAHLSAKKGQQYLLESVAMLRERFPELRCLLVGEGIMRDELQNLADRLGIGQRVMLLGYRNDVADVMNAADIVVLPSIAKEGLGLVLVEAALLGIPTIGSAAPGIDEAVQDGVTGFLFTPGDSTQLADRIAELLSDAELRNRLGTAGKQRAVRLFSLGAMTDATEAVYRELINRSKT